MRANVMDRVDLVRIGIDAAVGIAPHGTVLPAALPQFIGHVEVFVGPIIARLVRR
jgi:hypothetical protein